MRAFVGFFGLNRSARWTLPSIRRNVLQPLRDSGFELFLAGHFNQPEAADTGADSSRRHTLYDPIEPFGLDLGVGEPQDDTNIADLLPAVLSVPYHFKDDSSGRRRHNLMHQLHSLRRLGQILDGLGQDFDMYAFLRPDLDYIDRLQPRILDPLLRGDANLLVPGWEEWDGINDRFAFCDRTAVPVYLARWRWVDAFCKEYGYLHSERLLAYAVRDAGLKVAKIPMRALRVRPNGWTSPEGFQLPNLLRLKHRARRMIGALRRS